jgi:RND family efflux transporter MFP subunit
LAAVGVVALFVYRRVHARKTTATPQYFTVPASIGPVSVDVSGSGTVAPVQTASVSAPVPGTVAQVDVKIGQTVQAGQTLYSLNDTSGLAAQLQSAQAQLAAAQAQLASLQNPQASISATTIANDQAHIQQDQDTLSQDQATLAEAQQTAATDAKVTAPQAGTIMTVNLSPGASVQQGATIATLLPSSTPAVTVAVPEEDLSYLPVGTLATIVLPMQASVQAKVVSVATLPSGSVTVNADGSISAGSGGGHGASTMTESEYDLTLQFTQSPGSVPQGEAVQVEFQYQGNPPSAYTWSFAGSMVVPQTVNLTAPGSGTLTSVPSVGEQVSSGQQVAAIDDTTAQQAVTTDQNRVQQDETTLQTAELQLHTDQNPAAATATSIQTSEAQIASDQVTVQRDQQNLQGLTVTAPFAGEVTAVDIAAGQTLAAGATGLTLDSTALEVSVPVDELDVGQVKVGQTVQLAVSAFPGAGYTGTVSAISPVPSSSGGATTYPVTVTLYNTQNLQEGMSATTTIQVSSVASTLRVPAQAVTLSAGSGSSGTLQIMQNGTPVTRTVKVGLVGTNYDQILSGIQVGQLVVAGVATATTTGTTGGGGGAGFALRGAGALAGGGFPGAGGFGGGGAAFRRGG